MEREKAGRSRLPPTHSFNHTPSTSFQYSFPPTKTPPKTYSSLSIPSTVTLLVSSPTTTILVPLPSKHPSPSPPPSLTIQAQRSEMSSPIAQPEHVCYVQCNYCNTVLAVNVPRNSMFNIVTIRCGHCANLLSVNMEALVQSIPVQDLQKLQSHNIGSQANQMDYGTSSKCGRTSMLYSGENVHQQMLPIRPPEKRQRAPSAYNRFIKEEIQRIKTNNPEITHREAFSTAAKNWAHFPHIHFGLSMEGNKQGKLDEAILAQGGK